MEAGELESIFNIFIIVLASGFVILHEVNAR
jgi:hypothetical protein